MKKVLLVFVLFMWIGISFITRAEDYTQSANCINDLVSEYDKFKVNYETSVSKEKYEDALLYIKTMQNYLVSMKNSVCYNVAKDEIVKIYSSLSEIYKKVDTAMVNKNVQDVTNDLLAQNSSNTELQSAITWMYEYSLTSYRTVDDFMGESYLTREQAAKFFVEFAKKILGKVVDETKVVKLSDLKKANPTLQSYIKEANQLGLFKGTNGKYLPLNNLTKAQALAVIIRAKDGTKNEAKSNGAWYRDYYNLSSSYSMLKWLEMDYFKADSENIKRKEVALLLYRLKNYIASNNSWTTTCQNTFGAYSYSLGLFKEDWTPDCFCTEWYNFDKNTTRCVTADQVCHERYWEHSYSDWSLDDNWLYNCFCEEWYDPEDATKISPCIKK